MIKLKMVLLVVLVGWVTPSFAVEDLRICGEPERYESGRIKRSSVVLRQFKEIHPCPRTGLNYGPCSGWSMDHVIPLACGGCDSMENLQWLPNQIKSAAGKYPKDRWERKIYCTPMQLIEKD